ncbi:MAG: SGNH/GDSL hydrolase family protein [Bacilli bacterium]|nr:SGNH/GDSL hydrolase family protein [Bacilli bacterium]
MKKIIILVLIIGLPILIYIMTINNKVYYIALGDSLAAGQNPYKSTAYGYADYVADNLRTRKKLDFYTKKFAVSGYRIIDLINDINDNKKILIDNKEITIKHALAKSDIITISIGSDDLFYKMGINGFDSVYYSETDSRKYVDEVILDVDNLLVLIKKYCKEDIILIGYYNPLWHMKKDYAKELDPVFVYANKRMKEISKKNSVIYIDIHKMFENNTDYLPNPIDIHPSDEGYSAISKRVIEAIDKYILN